MTSTLILLALARLPVKERSEATALIKGITFDENDEAEGLNKLNELLVSKNASLRSRLVADEAELQALLQKIKKQRIGILPITDPRYPSILKTIYDPPPILFYLGDLNESLLNKPRVAIVGSRQADREGVEIAKRFGLELAARGIALVSGLALGIDAAAHRGAISGTESNATIAVLGNGLPDIYPRTNFYLGQDILKKGGVIISQFEPGTPPFAHNFLDRNRVIAGLSQGVIVIQAIKRSGSLVTARYALEEGREVLVVPGSINNYRYEGSNQLLRQGAAPVTSPNEILDTLSLTYDELESNEMSHKDSSDKPLTKTTSHDPLVNLLLKNGTMLIDELKARLGNPSDFSSKLLDLELNGRIKRLPGNQIALEI